MLRAVAEDPNGEAHDLHQTFSSSTGKADAGIEQPNFQTGLAKGSAADLKAMSFSAAVSSHQPTATSTVHSENQKEFGPIPMHEHSMQNLSSRDAMPPPAMSKHHQQHALPLTTPRSTKLASRRGHDIPASSTPARGSRSGHWTPSPHVSSTSSRHFTKKDTRLQTIPDQQTPDFRFPVSTTPQYENRRGTPQQTRPMHERTPKRIRYGQQSALGQSDSAFGSMDSPYKRTTFGLYANQLSDQVYGASHNAILGSMHPNPAPNGVLTEYPCDPSTPQAIRVSKHSHETVPRNKPNPRGLRGGSAFESLGSSIYTSPTTVRPSSSVNNLQTFAFHGDPVNTYMEQRSRSMCKHNPQQYRQANY